MNSIDLNQHKDYPEAYRRGFIYFYDLKFKVNQNVLIPRIETEKIIDIVKEYISDTNLENKISILDVGTGSGCIAITLAKNIENTQVTAIDISKEALEVAKMNAINNHIDNKIKFFQNDLLQNFIVPQDIIVSNLPYIPTDYISHLDSSVKDYEPLLALDGGKDGFDLYRRLFAQIINNKINPKLIIIEFDDTHAELALIEGKKYFPNHTVKIENDKYKYPRFLIIQN